MARREYDGNRLSTWETFTKATGLDLTRAPAAPRINIAPQYKGVALTREGLQLLDRWNSLGAGDRRTSIACS